MNLKALLRVNKVKTQQREDDGNVVIPAEEYIELRKEQESFRSSRLLFIKRIHSLKKEKQELTAEVTKWKSMVELLTSDIDEEEDEYES